MWQIIILIIVLFIALFSGSPEFLANIGSKKESKSANISQPMSNKLSPKRSQDLMTNNSQPILKSILRKKDAEKTNKTVSFNDIRLAKIGNKIKMEKAFNKNTMSKEEKIIKNEARSGGAKKKTVSFDI